MYYATVSGCSDSEPCDNKLEIKIETILLIPLISQLKFTHIFCLL